MVLNYNKILLFHTDRRYFFPGHPDQNRSFILETKDGYSVRSAVAICMDINYRLKVDYFEFPLAHYLVKEKTELLLFPTAWTLKEGEGLNPEDEQKEMQEQINYWAMRLLPHCDDYWGLDRCVGKVIDGVEQRNSNEWIFVAADRVGRDNKTTFKGTSCVLKFNPFFDHLNGNVEIYKEYQSMGMIEEGAKRCTVVLNRGKHGVPIRDIIG